MPETRQPKSDVQARRGVSLVELLIAILIGAIVMGTIVGVLYTYIALLDETDDLTTARQKGEMALSIIQNPILHSGLGMPSSPDAFAEAFASGDSHEWKDLPVFSEALKVGGTSDELYVVYAVPTDAFATESCDITGDFEVKISSNLKSSNNLIKDGPGKSGVKSWVTFPMAGIPLLVKEKCKDSIKLRSFAGGERIFKYDHLHYIRAMHVKVNDGSLSIDDFEGGNLQPLVDGIEKIHFKWNNAGSVLTAYVLARGNHEDSGLDDGRDIDGWPSEVTIDSVLKRYRLTVARGGWRVRN